MYLTIFPATKAFITKDDTLWYGKQVLTVESSLPHLLQLFKSTGRWEAMKLQWSSKSKYKPHMFWDADMGKLLEAIYLAKICGLAPSTLINEARQQVEWICQAQLEDGYVNSYYQTVQSPKNRFTNLRDDTELFCLGHLIEAAIMEDLAENSTPGTSKFLSAMRKYIALIQKLFPSGTIPGFEGHQEIELALLQLADHVQEEKYAILAKYFTLERGGDGGEHFHEEARKRGENPEIDWPYFFAGPQNYHFIQADKPVADQTNALGHAVRFTYFQTAVAQIDYISAKRLWDSMLRKMYPTGAIGSVSLWEGFHEKDFVLPERLSDGCYAETCASIGIMFFARQLLRTELKSEYGDVMERALYNNVLGGVSLDGKGFYYSNPVRTTEPFLRQQYFACCCCPQNVQRLLLNLGSFIYSGNESLLAVHLFISSFVDLEGGGRLYQKGPSVNKRLFHLTAESVKEIELAIRIPSWADEYHLMLANRETTTLLDGYLFVKVKPGESIILEFSMGTHLVIVDPRTATNKAFVHRGPYVYCVEDVDNEFSIDNDAVLDRHVTFSDSLHTIGNDCFHKLHCVTKCQKPMILIPWYVRANRGGKGKMRMWLNIEGEPRSAAQ